MILAFEGFAAQLAGESALVAVRQFVLGQRRRAGKHFAAHLRVQKEEEEESRTLLHDVVHSTHRAETGTATT